MTESQAPQSLSQQAAEAYQLGDFEQAASHFGAAAEAFLNAGNLLDAAEMKNNASVCLLRAGKKQEAYDIVTDTYQVFAEHADTRRKALALGNEASALEALGRREAAMELFKQSAQAFQEIGDDESFATVSTNLAKMQMTSGKFVDGVLTMWVGLSGLKNPSMSQRILKFLYSILARMLRVRPL